MLSPRSPMCAKLSAVWTARALQGPRHHGDVLDLVEGAAIAEALFRPRQANDLERLVEAGAVLRERHAKPVKLAGDRAAAHPELEPAAGEHVGGRRLLRRAQGMVER